MQLPGHDACVLTAENAPVLLYAVEQHVLLTALSLLQAAKTAGGPTRVEKAKIGLIQFHLSPPKADIENTVVISDYAQVRRWIRRCCCVAAVVLVLGMLCLGWTHCAAALCTMVVGR